MNKKYIYSKIAEINGLSNARKEAFDTYCGYGWEWVADNVNGEVIPLNEDILFNTICKLIPEPQETRKAYMKLYDGDPNCDHEVYDASGGGVKCSKCSGWFCF